MHMLTDPQLWASFLTLTVLELVLGIDNLVFIAILANRLPERLQSRARRVGLFLALFMRLALLACAAQLAQLTDPLFSFAEHGFSIRDLIFVGGGLFLIYKGTKEIHAKIEDEEEEPSGRKSSFSSVIVQMVMFDIIFSLDSIITAIGMANEYVVMAGAIVTSVIVMVVASDMISGFIQKHPTVKMLALSFLLLIGMTLIADGSGIHIPKGYIYVAMAFSGTVELLNQLVAHRKKRRRKS